MFTLAQIGLDHREDALCDTVLTLAAGIELGQWQRSDDPNTADLVIISAERQTALAALGDNPSRLVAIVGEAPERPSDWLHAPRPLSYAGLLRLLREAESRLGAEQHSFEAWTEHFLHPPVTLETTPVDTNPSPDESTDIPSPSAAENEEEDEEANAATPPAPAEAPEAPASVTEAEPAPRTTIENDTPISTEPDPLPTLEIAIDDVEILESLLARTAVDEPLTEIHLKPSAITEAPDLPGDSDNGPSETMLDEQPRLAKVIPLPLVKQIKAPPDEADAADPGKNVSPAQPHRPNHNDLFRPARRFIPKLRLLGLVREIIADGDSYTISHVQYPDIFVWPRSGMFQCEADLREMPALFRRPWSEFKLTSLRQYPALADTPSHPLHLLSYLAALHGSEGKLMLGIDADASFKLKERPNFDLLGCTTVQERLTTHLLDYPATLGELATATQTAIPEVIDFTNACREIGLIDEVSRNPKTPPSNSGQGLFGRLRKRWSRSKGARR